MSGGLIWPLKSAAAHAGRMAKQQRQQTRWHLFSAAMGGHPYAAAAVLWLAEQEGPVGVTELARGVGMYTAGGVKLANHLQRSGLVAMAKHRGIAGKPRYEVSLSVLAKSIVEPLRVTAEAFRVAHYRRTRM